jgi:hypothetical protein
MRPSAAAAAAAAALAALAQLRGAVAQASCASNGSTHCPLPPWPATYNLSQSSIVYQPWCGGDNDPSTCIGFLNGACAVTLASDCALAHAAPVLAFFALALARMLALARALALTRVRLPTQSLLRARSFFLNHICTHVPALSRAAPAQ